MKGSHFSWSVFILLICVSCDTPRTYEPVDCGDFHLRVERYDSVLQVKGAGLPGRINGIRHHHRVFSDRYFQTMLRMGVINDDSLLAINVSNWLRDPLISTLNDSIANNFEDIGKWRHAMEQAFCRYRHFFPGRTPEMVTYVSGCSYQMAVTDSVLGIGLDMYLDNSARIYYSLGLPQYRVRRMKSIYIVSDAVKAWVSTEMEEDPGKGDLISDMIREGIVLYALDVVLPDVPDSVKIGYTAKHIEWCRKYEEDVWAHLMAKQMLFSTDIQVIQKYTGDGPYTKDFGTESPPRIGAWIGWRIVRSYMNRHLEITPAALLHQHDAAQILNRSGYRPGL